MFIHILPNIQDIAKIEATVKRSLLTLRVRYYAYKKHAWTVVSLRLPRLTYAVQEMSSTASKPSANTFLADYSLPLRWM